MCGINGLVGFPQAKSIIIQMNELSKHRGPDAEGIWEDPYVTLGHKRLSIIDLSPQANQPFMKGNLVIVFNGEIYNFLELREELIKKGTRFQTRSDTEVILELFREKRERSFTDLIGMFAFCIYDVQKRELFLVRDYFGIKPLYYQQGNGCLAFSSELKTLVGLPGFGLEINPRALVSCLNYLWVYGDESIFKGIQKVPPAHYLHYKIHEGYQIKPYWSPVFETPSLSETQWADRLKETIDRSVQRHLIADVPVGGFLSGGVDSSLIAALARNYNDNLSTFTISLSDPDKKIERMPDDNLYAAQVARKYGIDHKDIPVQPSAIKLLKEIVYMLDEPIGDPAAINTYLICQMARRNNIKVLLSGMGADEIFAGYRRHYAVLLADNINRRFPLIHKTLQVAVAPLPVRVSRSGLRAIRWAKRYSSFARIPFHQAYLQSFSYYSGEELRELLNGQCDQAIDDMFDYYNTLFQRGNKFDKINQMCYIDIHMFLPGLNLTYTDRASMAASVEVRVPFVDRDVVTLAMSIPGRLKIRGKTTKYILKKVASQYLPRQIAYRPKASFGMPIRAWISHDLRKYIDEVLTVENIKKRGLLNPIFVRNLIENDRRGIEDNAYQIYQLLTLELWMQSYLDHRYEYANH